MDAALVDLVRRGQITQQMAERRSSTPDELRRLMGQGGLGAPVTGGGSPGMPGSGMPVPGNGARVG
jgi:twitching motility protein PilT